MLFAALFAVAFPVNMSGPLLRFNDRRPDLTFSENAPKILRKIPIDIVGTASSFELKDGNISGNCQKEVMVYDLYQLSTCDFFYGNKIPDEYLIGSLKNYKSMKIRNFFYPDSKKHLYFYNVEKFEIKKVLLSVSFEVDKFGNKNKCAITNSVAPRQHVIFCSKFQTDFPDFEPDSSREFPIKMLYTVDVWAMPVSHSK